MTPSKEQFKKRIAFLREREQFMNSRKKRKPVTLEDVDVPIPDLPKNLKI